jgi:hypothetical protein
MWTFAAEAAFSGVCVQSPAGVSKMAGYLHFRHDVRNGEATEKRDLERCGKSGRQIRAVPDQDFPAMSVPASASATLFTGQAKDGTVDLVHVSAAAIPASKDLDDAAGNRGVPARDPFHNPSAAEAQPDSGVSDRQALAFQPRRQLVLVQRSEHGTQSGRLDRC